MITKSFYSHFKHLSKDDFKFNQGIEKEGLRVDERLEFSKNSHQESLGHKLTHPHITTDYNENLLEFITPVFQDTGKLLNFLRDLQKYTLNKIDDELIWPSSFPAKIDKEENIPIAYYGESFSGQIKSLYRLGLANRYGKSMQSIAGLHYNFSFTQSLIDKLYDLEGKNLTKQEFQNQIYFKLIRNYRRYSWLLTYLFGASPVVDKSFLSNKEHKLDDLGCDNFGLETATSLRMGGLGYTSSAQEEISLCYNELETYVSTLEKSRLTSLKKYEEIGLKDPEGKFKQLNTNILQIDNEFYTRIRPKRVASRGESALLALDRRGVEYIEVRLLDLNPFEANGIDEESIEFIQAFLLFCMMDESQNLSRAECTESSDNYDKVVKFGLDKNLKLKRSGVDISVKDFSTDILSKMKKLNDSKSDLFDYTRSIEIQSNKIENPALLVSSQLLGMVSDGKSYLEIIKEQAIKHKYDLSNHSYKVMTEKELDQMAKQSLVDEEELTSLNSGSFEDYLNAYFEEIKI